MSGINKYYYLEHKKRGKSTATESPINDVLQQFMQSCHIDYNPYEQEIKDLFKQYTGAVIEKFTYDIHVSKNVLYVHTDLPSIKHELMMVRSALKDRINSELGKEILKNVIIK